MISLPCVHWWPDWLCVAETGNFVQMNQSIDLAAFNKGEPEQRDSMVHASFCYLYRSEAGMLFSRHQKIADSFHIRVGVLIIGNHLLICLEWCLQKSIKRNAHRKQKYTEPYTKSVVEMSIAMHHSPFISVIIHSKHLLRLVHCENVPYFALELLSPSHEDSLSQLLLSWYLLLLLNTDIRRNIL